MTMHGKNYDQLCGLIETFMDTAIQAMGQTDEMMAVAQRMADDSRDVWRDAAVHALDAALQLDDVGLRRKIQRLRDTLAASEEERRVG
jgi:hypothetical protein